MSEIKIVAAMMADDKTAYRFNEPLLDKPDTAISNILLVGNNVEVFARSTKSGDDKGFHESLLLPSVSTLIALGIKGADGKFLSDVLNAMDAGEKVTAVYGTDGRVWKVNSPVPGPDESAQIVKIAQSDDMVEIIALPSVGSDLDQAGYFMHFTLMPLSFLRVSAEAPLDEWLATQQAMLEEDGDDEDDDEDEDEDETPGLPTQHVAPPPPPPQTAPMSFIPQVPQVIPAPAQTQRLAQDSKPVEASNGATQPTPTE